LQAFSYYFVGAGSLVALMFWRVQILTVLFHSVKLMYREIGWIPVESTDNSEASADIKHDHDSDGEVEHQVDFVIQTSGSGSDSSNLKPNNQSKDEFVIHQLRHSAEHRKLNLTHRIKGSIREIQDQPIVFFAKRPIASVRLFSTDNSILELFNRTCLIMPLCLFAEFESSHFVRASK
jgi:hypothetical protein